MKCVICNYEIHEDSQFINGKWYHNKCIESQQQEVERLNNIINELEKELIKKIEAVKTIKNTLGEGAYVVNPHIDLLEQEYNYFYNKLQELEGNDKE